MKKLIKKALKLSPIPLTQNHKYDLQTKRIIGQLRPDRGLPRPLHEQDKAG